MTTETPQTTPPAGDAGPAAPGAAAAVAPSATAASGPAGSLEALYDLTLPVSIELGRTRMTVQEVLALGRGSVVQLERLVGEPVDVYVSDRHFAAGEVVVMGEQFGVRITRIFKSGVGDEA